MKKLVAFIAMLYSFNAKSQCPTYIGQGSEVITSIVADFEAVLGVKLSEGRVVDSLKYQYTTAKRTTTLTIERHLEKKWVGEERKNVPTYVEYVEVSFPDDKAKDVMEWFKTKSVTCSPKIGAEFISYNGVLIRFDNRGGFTTLSIKKDSWN
jgi:hypothetical protein